MQLLFFDSLLYHISPVKSRDSVSCRNSESSLQRPAAAIWGHRWKFPSLEGRYRVERVSEPQQDKLTLSEIMILVAPVLSYKIFTRSFGRDRAQLFKPRLRFNAAILRWWSTHRSKAWDTVRQCSKLCLEHSSLFRKFSGSAIGGGLTLFWPPWKPEDWKSYQNCTVILPTSFSNTFYSDVDLTASGWSRNIWTGSDSDVYLIFDSHLKAENTNFPARAREYVLELSQRNLDRWHFSQDGLSFEKFLKMFN